mmetsp:Transcript_96431/g.176585  ORF Transcript_96431/g.176585 Transcript_96431/m.176585 type:complete len:1064 (+) Transcript_96431:146-3337(+)
MNATTSVVMETTFDTAMVQVWAFLVSTRVELLLFAAAMVAYFALFSNAVPRNPKLASKKARMREDDDEYEANGVNSKFDSDDIEHMEKSFQASFDHGNHREVLRVWHAMKKFDKMPDVSLPQVVESMQRFKKDGTSILAEVEGYLRRNKGCRDVYYINKILEPLAKCLDFGLVEGIFGSLPSMDVQPNSKTYEALVHMHFTTRSFDQVAKLVHEMNSKGLALTCRTSLVCLKTSISAGKLDEAIKHFKEVSASADPASQAPRHVVMQLVELACRERRVKAVIEEAEAGRMPLTAEMLNAMLAECVRTKDQALAARLQNLSAKHPELEKSSKTYQLLIRLAGSDRSAVMQLLEEISQGSVEYSHEIGTAVLTAASQPAAKDVALVDALYDLVREKPGQGPTFLALVRFYVDVAQPAKACDIFEKHLKLRNASHGDDKRRSLLDARTEKFLVAAALQCGRNSLAAQIMEATPADTAKHISMIRGSAAKGDLAEAMNIFASLEASGADLTHSLWNTALDACVECRDFRRAEELMRRMQAADVADAVSYNTLIKAHLRNEYFDRARNLMDTMRKAGCTPNHVTFNELINALVRSDKESRRAQVWEVVEEMKKNGVQPNRITCSILLKSLKAKSSHTDVMRTMDLTGNMEEPMDEVLLSSVVEACVRIGKPSLLTQKLEEFRTGGISVTGAHTFGSLIKAYGYAKDIAGAWRCWKEMRSHHIKPTSITIGCMVEAVVSNGDADGGYELICQLLEDDQCRDQVNAVVFGSVLKGYGRTKRMERVWAVFREMLAQGIEPSVVTFNAVIDACARNGRMDCLSEVRKEMKARNLRPNLITYSTIIKGYCQRGDMSAALAALEDLRKTSGLRPDEIVFNTILEGCASAGLVAEGERLFEEMCSMGVQPSNYTLTVLVRLLGQARQATKAFEIVQEITQRYRFRMNSHVSSALLQACLNSRDSKRAAAVFEQAVRDRALPDARTSQQLIRSLISSGSATQAVSVLRGSLGVHGGGGSNAMQQSIDDAFVVEALCMLQERGGEGAMLAPKLIEEIRAVRPRLQLPHAASSRRPAY